MCPFAASIDRDEGDTQSESERDKVFGLETGGMEGEGGRADGLRKQHSHYIHLDCPNIDLSKRHYDMGCLSRTYAPRIPLLSPMM